VLGATALACLLVHAMPSAAGWLGMFVPALLNSGAERWNWSGGALAWNVSARHVECEHSTEPNVPRYLANLAYLSAAA
jgi:hypothetical protein